ncbi:MAG: isopeptide-forming domain-containing fimbrial protein, partial [Paracoccaceae bacterium]
MDRIPEFEPLEDRIVLDGEATVLIDGPDTAFIGQDDVEFVLTFDNTADTGESGYAPFIDLVLPQGADGDDGVILNDIDFLGATLVAVQTPFDVNGEAEHPFAVDTNGDPVIVTGTPGDTLVSFELPYGSFSAGNPPVDVTVSLDLSDFANLETPLTLETRGGFSLGCDAADNPATDPSTFGATDTLVLTPQLFTLDKFNDAPEGEAATGPSYVYTQSFTIVVADGQTLTDFSLIDDLPPEMVYVGNLITAGGTPVTEPTPGPAATGNDTLQVDFASLSGTVTVSFDYWLAEVEADGGTDVIDPASGDRTPVTNTVTGEGDWTPTDPDDDPVRVSATDTDSRQAASLAIQKSGQLTTDGDAPGPTEQDVYTFTLDVQVSDYFTFGDLLINDTLGNGLTFVTGSAQVVATTEESGGITAPIDLTSFQTQTFGSGATAGQTFTEWDLSAALASQTGFDGLLTGSATDGVPGGGQTTVTITYQARVDDTFDDDGSIADAEVSQGDTLGNDVTIQGRVIDNDTGAPLGLEEDDSDFSDTLPFGAIESKSIFAVNGVAPGPNPIIAAGDTVTWSIIYDAPIGSFEQLAIQDNLPQNVFDATEVTNFISPSDPNVPPPAGSAQFGPQDQFGGAGGGPVTVTPTAPDNGVRFDFGTLSTDPRAPLRIEVLFTVTIVDADFASEILLTNQATASELNTTGGTFDTTAIAQFVYAEPALEITKGVVADDVADGTFDQQEGPVTFSGPGANGARFASPITSDLLDPALGGTPIDANLSGVDAGDTVTFAIVVQNLGRAPDGAFDVSITDDLPAGFAIPSTPAGLNLSVTDGNGTPLAFTGGLFAPGGIELTDQPGQGAIGAYTPGGGTNVVIVTYDLVLEQSVTATQSLTNTAEVDNYAAVEGGIDRALGELADTATVRTGDVAVTKTLTDREVGVGGPNEVLVGEEFTFTVRVDLQEGTYANVRLTDEVRGGTFADFEMLSAELTDFGATLSSSNGVVQGASGTVAVDGNSVSFDLGTLTVAADQDATNDFLEFTVTARSLGSGDAGANDRLGNTARFLADGTPNASANAAVRLTEPLLEIEKTADATVARAGDTITYDIVVDNVDTGPGGRDAPAYDLVLTDVLDPNVVLNAGSVTVSIDGGPHIAAAVITGNGAGDTTIRIELPVLGKQEQLTVSYTADVRQTVAAGVTIDNTADLTFDSLPDDDTDDERDYSVSDDAVVVAASPEVDKSVTTTSNPDTADGAPPALSIGETVTYTIAIDIPGGTVDDAVLTDVLPSLAAGDAGTLTYVSSVVVSIGASIGGSLLSVGDAGTNSGTDTVFDFGDLFNTEDGAQTQSDRIVVEVTAIVADLPANGDGDLLTNLATFTTALADASDDATVEVVEPSLDIAKSVAPTTADAGDTVTFTVTSANSGTGPAYDIVIDDALADAGLTAGPPTSVAIVILDGTGSPVTPSEAPSFIYPTPAGGIEVTVPVLLPDQSVRVTFDAVVTDAAEFSGTVDNTAVLTR